MPLLANLQPSVKIGGAAPDARFYMSTVPTMPTITLTAEMQNYVPTPAYAPPPMFTWQFGLVYDSYIPTVPGQRTYEVRAKTHPAMSPIVSPGPQVRVPFSTLMCGRLTVTVTATLTGGKVVTATRTDILIGGTNPSVSELVGKVSEPVVRKLIMQESGRKQFSDSNGRTYVAQAINPNWSSDNLRGVGLGQLTNPPPTDSDIWDWTKNASSLLSRFKQNRTSSDGFANSIKNSSRFIGEVAAFNAWRTAEGLAPLAVTVPALTTDQRDGEALRRYNGLGPKVPGQYLARLHEFEPAMTTYTSANRKDSGGAPVVSDKLLSVASSGAITWRQITGAERRARYVAAGARVSGEPDYVAQVFAQPS